LSPGLNYLAYAKETPSGADAIYVVDTRSGESKTLVTLDLTHNCVVSMDWSPDSSALLYLTYGDRRALFLTTLNTGGFEPRWSKCHAYSCVPWP